MHYFGNPRHSVNDRIYGFDWVFLEITVENCIVGMFLICLIGAVIYSGMRKRRADVNVMIGDFSPGKLQNLAEEKNTLM